MLRALTVTGPSACPSSRDRDKDAAGNTEVENARDRMQQCRQEMESLDEDDLRRDELLDQMEEIDDDIESAQIRIATQERKKVFGPLPQPRALALLAPPPPVSPQLPPLWPGAAFCDSQRASGFLYSCFSVSTRPCAGGSLNAGGRRWW